MRDRVCIPGEQLFQLAIRQELDTARLEVAARRGGMQGIVAPHRIGGDDDRQPRLPGIERELAHAGMRLDPGDDDGVAAESCDEGGDIGRAEPGFVHDRLALARRERGGRRVAFGPGFALPKPLALPMRHAVVRVAGDRGPDMRHGHGLRAGMGEQRRSAIHHAPGSRIKLRGLQIILLQVN